MHYLIIIASLLGCATFASAQRTPSGATQAAPSSSDRQRGGQTPPASNPSVSPRGNDSSSARPGNSTPKPPQTTQERSGQNPNTQTRIGRQMQNAEQQRLNQTRSNPQGQTNAKGSNAASNKKIAPVATKSAEKGKVNWMTLEQAIEKNKTEKRKIYVDVFTDWCGWCKKMDSTSFVHPAVAKYLNEHYWPVKFNAEQQQDITFNGKTYHFRRNGARGVHELAIEWLNNRLSFPSSVFLDENQHTIQALSTYLDATKLEAIINYFGTDSHKKTPWEVYERNFVGQ